MQRPRRGSVIPFGLHAASPKSALSPCRLTRLTSLSGMAPPAPSPHHSLRRVLAACAVVLAGYAVVPRREPYTFDHVDLNRLPGQAGRPQTEWLNMGFWRDTDIFAEASRGARSLLERSDLKRWESCTEPLRSLLSAPSHPAFAALAKEVLDAAHLQPGGHHLDVAHGSGDSLLLALSPSYPSQSSLSAITSDPAHAERARERTLAALSSSSSSDVSAVGLNFVCSDAVYRPTTSPPSHPFAPSPDHQPRFTSIICLDAAYHFSTRLTFLTQAFDRLAPGGTLALGDILSSRAYPSMSSAASEGWTFDPSSAAPPPLSFAGTHVLPRLLSLLAVPSTNLVPLPELARQLQEIGFDTIVLRDVSADVWPGFARFLSARDGLGWRVFGRLVGWLGQEGGLRWVVVSATKPVAGS